MFRFLALVLALSAVVYGEVPESDEIGDRIVGGSIANIHNIPWQLSLRRNGTHFCGATLISPIWAVTAAHCIRDLPSAGLTLLGGTANRQSGGQVRHVNRMITHPKYNEHRIDNDIALLRVSSAFDLSASLAVASLPAQGAPVATGAHGIVSGWGTLKEKSSSLSATLQQVSLPVVAQATCEDAYWAAITGNMLCAGYKDGGRDACEGDYGGPYVINKHLVGIVSWGNGCARPNSYSVYVRVSNYRNWIKTNAGV